MKSLMIFPRLANLFALWFPRIPHCSSGHVIKILPHFVERFITASKPNKLGVLYIRSHYSDSRLGVKKYATSPSRGIFFLIYLYHILHYQHSWESKLFLSITYSFNQFQAIPKDLNLVINVMPALHHFLQTLLLEKTFWTSLKNHCVYYEINAFNSSKFPLDLRVANFWFLPFFIRPKALTN